MGAPRRRAAPRRIHGIVQHVFAAASLLLSILGIPSMAQTVPPDAVVASLRVSRNPVYEHECFDIVLAIEIRGVQLGRSVELSGMPDTPLLKFGQFKELPIQRPVKDGKQVEIRSYKCETRAMATGSVPMSLALRLAIVRSQQGPFGIARFESPISVPVAPATVRIIPLPTTPTNVVFSGAVGQFQFSASAAPTDIAPGELVHISSRIAGRGWTEDILPPRISPRGGAFRAYEPKAIPTSPGETPELLFEQTLVPQTTNATMIPLLSFTYFDPVAGMYQTATAGPFRLHFHPRGTVVEDQINTRIDVTGPPQRPAKSRSLFAGLSPSTKWGIVTVAGIYWVTVAVGMGTLAARLRRGMLGALALLAVAFTIFAVGATLTRKRLIVKPAGVAIRQEDARVIPAPDAFVSFTIPKDTPLTRIDELGDWVKIEFMGNRGWIPSSALEGKR